MIDIGIKQAIKYKEDIIITICKKERELTSKQVEHRLA